MIRKIITLTGLMVLLTILLGKGICADYAEITAVSGEDARVFLHFDGVKVGDEFLVFDKEGKVLARLTVTKIFGKLGAIAEVKPPSAASSITAGQRAIPIGLRMGEGLPETSLQGGATLNALKPYLERTKDIRGIWMSFKAKMKMGEQELTIEGEGESLLPDKFRLSYTMPTNFGPMKMLTVCDGKRLWTEGSSQAGKTITTLDLTAVDSVLREGGFGGILPLLNQVGKMVYTSDLHQALTKVGQLKVAGKEMVGKRECLVLEVRYSELMAKVKNVLPSDTGAAYEKMWIGEDGVVYLDETYTSDDKLLSSMKLLDVKLNPGLSASSFTYVSEPDAVIADTTNEIVGLLRGILSQK